MRVTTPVSRNDGHFPIKFEDIPLWQTQQRHFRPLNLRNIQMTDKELMSAELNRLREQASLGFAIITGHQSEKTSTTNNLKW